MSRRGFALLTVLWLVAALTALAAGALAVAGQGAAASRNRIVVLRASWAAEACAEILQAHYAERGDVEPVDTTDLGTGVWCRAEVEDAGGRLDLNRASPEQLRLLLGTDSLADAVLDWRDPDEVPRRRGAEADWYRARGRRLPRDGAFASVDELAFVRGLDSAFVARLAPVLTVRGAGRVDLNAASAEVLAAMPGLDPPAVQAVLALRSMGHRLDSPDALLARLDPRSRAALMSRYQELLVAVAFRPDQITVRAEGGVRGRLPIQAIRLTLVPASGRLTVVGREVVCAP
jgi:general secretion pathway protein K